MMVAYVITARVPPMEQPSPHPVSRVIRRILLGVAAVVFLIEDLLIRHIGPLFGRLAALRFVARAETWAARQSPRVSVFLLVAAIGLVYPIHLLAIPCFVAGRWMLGIGIIICAKLVAAGVVGRLLHVCRPRLMELAWFRRLDLWVSETRSRILTALHQTAFWRSYLQLKARWATSGWVDRWRRAVRRPVA